MSGGKNTIDFFYDQTYDFVCTSPCAWPLASNGVLFLPISADSGDLTGLAGLPFLFVPGLTDQGGTSKLGQTSVGACTDATCDSLGASPPLRIFTAGSVTAPAPPCVPGGGRQCVVTPVTSASDVRETGRKRSF